MLPSPALLFCVLSAPPLPSRELSGELSEGVRYSGGGITSGIMGCFQHDVGKELKQCWLCIIVFNRGLMHNFVSSDNNLMNQSYVIRAQHPTSKIV